MSNSLAPIVESIWIKQLESFDSGRLLTAEEIFETYPELQSDVESAVDVIFNEFEIRNRKEHSRPDPAEFIERFPQYDEALRRQFNLLEAFDSATLKSGSVPTLDSDSSKPKVVERFTDRKVIGQGATATVEHAFDELLKHHVALKKLHKHLQTSGRATHRLKREAQTVARLHHPNIVPLYEIADDGDGVTLVSRFINGKNLKQLLEAGEIQGVQDIVKWTRQIAEALDYAHANDVTHRDVKPSNILIDENGNGLLTDFGMASFSQSANEITQTGELIGTPAFMSPEQALGQTKSVDKRSDVYSLGATLFFLLAGHPPFEGSFPVVLKQVADKEAPPLIANQFLVPSDLATIVGKCLKKSPTDRYASARELADDLRRFQSGDLILARPSGWIEKGLKKLRKHPLVSLGVATILLLAAFLSGSLLQLDQVRKQRNRAQSAEVTNRQLHAISSIDTGKLALQRGQFDKAIESFQVGVGSGIKDPHLVQFHLVEANLAKGDFEEANSNLEQAEAFGANPDSPEFKYWQNEIAAVSNSAVEFTPLMEDELASLDESKQFFLKGLDSPTSEESLQFFRDAIKLDPSHHGARRMSLIMALSLARFDEVLEEVKFARLMNPGDVDFQLIEALARSASGDKEASLQIIENCELPIERKVRWNEFSNFLYDTAYDRVDEASEMDNLNFVASILTTFNEEFLELTMERRWRFPQKISRQFEVLVTEDINSMKQTALVEIARKLVKVHSEGTLLFIAGEQELTADDAIEELELSRDYFARSTQTPAFVRKSKEASWLGMYVTSMVLNMVHQHDRESNLEFMVKSAAQVDAGSFDETSACRSFYIPLITSQNYGLAQAFAARATEIADTDEQKSEAWWHLALIHQKQGRWQKVLESCAAAKASFSEGFQPVHNWPGIEGHSIGELKKLMD